MQLSWLKLEYKMIAKSAIFRRVIYHGVAFEETAFEETTEDKNNLGLTTYDPQWISNHRAAYSCLKS